WQYCFSGDCNAIHRCRDLEWLRSSTKNLLVYKTFYIQKVVNPAPQEPNVYRTRIVLASKRRSPENTANHRLRITHRLHLFNAEIAVKMANLLPIILGQQPILRAEIVPCPS